MRLQPRSTRTDTLFPYSTSSVLVEFAVGGPLIDNVPGLRVSGQILKSDGFSSNRYDGGRLDGRDGQSFRAILEFTPTEGITNTMIGDRKSTRLNSSH